MPTGWRWPPTPVMEAAGAACTAALEARAVAWQPAERVGRVAAPIVVPSMQLGGVTWTPRWRRGPFVLDCQLALALDELGAALRAAGIREVVFDRIYGWSQVRVGGRTLPLLSRHALGLAVDIAAVVGDDGREASVAASYLRGDPLLRAVEEAVAASGAFRGVLGPRNDPRSHRDHLHVEARATYAAPGA